MATVFLDDYTGSPETTFLLLVQLTFSGLVATAQLVGRATNNKAR